MELKEIGSMYLEIIKSWMKIKEDSEWGLFASIFPMLLKTFASEHIIFPLWDYILNKMSDLKEFLTVLSIIVDTCHFTSSYSTKLTYIHHDIYCKNTFWLLLLEGLRSPLQQYRKQALYIMKRVTDFMSKTDTLHLGLTKAEVTPFICSKSDDSALPIDSINQKFFLVYEASEEKQYHLVTPALTHITSLVKANKEHKSCQCFNIEWLRCILEKILHHENNNIVKWSVLYVCKLDSIIHIFDSQFLKMFVSILNNSFLYECQSNEDCPEIVRELSTFFRCMGETSLLNIFLKKVSEITWGPIAIFYIIHTLRVTSQETVQRNNWRVAELNAVKSLVETNLSMHSHILRIASQIELLRTIPNFVREIDNLTLLANVLATFPSEEGLTRGRFPWDIITAWLRKVLTKEDAVTFVEQTCTRYSCENLVCEVSPRTFALMIFLLHDAGLIFSCKMCPTEKALNKWLSSLNDIEMRPYANIRSSIDIAEFMSHSLNFFTQGETYCVMTHLISLYIHATFKLLIKNMKKMATGLTYEDYTRYTAILSSHIAHADLVMPKRDVNSYTIKLRDESIRLLKNTQHRQNMQYLYGLCILHLCQDILTSSTHEGTFYTVHLLNTQAIPIQTDNDAKTMNLKGKIASEYYLLLSRLTYRYLLNSPMHTWIPTSTLLTNLLKFLELGKTEIISEVATILILMIDNGAIRDTNDRETLEYIFQSCWRSTFVSKKNNIFWTAIQNLTGVIVNDNFLLLPGATEFITEFVDQLVKEGNGMTRFKRILLSKMERLNVSNLMRLGKPLLNCLLHGSVHRRDERVESHVYLFIIKHLGQYFPKHILVLDHNNDAAVRASAMIILHRIVSIPELNYVMTIVPLIFETLEEYKNKRYFNDSYIHKLKHRLMQILLILEPVMSKELVAVLQKNLRDSIFSESNQHSVRLMQEWLMIRIFARNSDLHDELWKFFAESIEKRPGRTISVASIVYHVTQLLSGASQKIFIRTALPYVAQCCLGQQFNVRLYNQFILIRLCKLMKQANDDDSICDYNGIYQAASLQQAKSTKNFMEIQDNFYFSSFHPIDDYSLQTIYFELPRLTNISRDEWISPDVFKAFMFEQNDNHPLQLYNVNSFLSDTTASIYLTKPLAGDMESLTNNVETYLEGLHDIQRKIDPSKLTIQLYNDNFGIIESAHREVSQLHEGLIVVASLVSRPPNLGGIARTCEIFGVKSLVIANLDCVKDKDFQCLSVSAEKWINMIQVTLHELQQYLLEKKSAGWSIVGAEQTANSINLLEAKFEKKTILVLGNEKDGIPANFIPLFNTCVEIPQVGVIRSLNVHVAAAICIWQYASQCTLK
ncbi:Probable methyltransferase TARBP1 [Harpegnathos saltator]|uniref:Probable methyltransferase TARBP1 n=3 Tax=Harpegnathos saltator TaxID=610380 RepID=E2BFJ1_HARSA|nr:Probable methyltransferase TARBP1 [Harpegnathos saltator]